MTSTEAAIAVMARLYGPDAESQRQSLLDIADGLHTQISALYASPSVADAVAVASNLDGAQRALMRYAETMRREGDS